MTIKEVDAWVKRANKKKAKLIRKDGADYHIVYFDKGKVRVGVVSDGMLTRYGIKCRGAMYDENPLSLWQSGPGSCDLNDVEIMQDYLRGDSDLPDFDFSKIKNLRT